MSKRGRPKGKKTVTHRVVENSQVEIVPDSQGGQKFVVIDEKVTYTFTNTRPGKLYFTREDGKADEFKGREKKDDITPREYEILIKGIDFQEGWLLLEGHDDEGPKNENVVTNSFILGLLEDYQENKPKLIKLIDGMTSDFAVRRIKDLLVEKDMPSSLTVRCDMRLAEIEEEFIKNNKAPIHKGPRGEL